MSENEIVKHIEGAYKALQNPKTHWLHKLQEVLIEIAIIVFAVTISIWFHNWSDNIKQHREEMDFLAGFKQDIQYDLASARYDRAFYVERLADLKYLARVGAGQPLSSDSMMKYNRVFFSNTELEPHASRYEALKGSGKMGIIENASLLNNIITLHEEAIKHVQSLETAYADYANRLGNFLQEHGTLTPDGKIANGQALLRNPQMRLMIDYGISTISLNMLKVHDTCIAQCDRVIAQIDQEQKKD